MTREKIPVALFCYFCEEYFSEENEKDVTKHTKCGEGYALPIPHLPEHKQRHTLPENCKLLWRICKVMNPERAKTLTRLIVSHEYGSARDVFCGHRRRARVSRGTQW